MDAVRAGSLLHRRNRVVVAFSGGPDSLALLSALSELRRLIPLAALSACHVDHGLRGAKSSADARFARRFCSARGIPCDVVRVRVHGSDAAKRYGTEAAARLARYAALRQIATKRQADVVAAGHNADDAAETVLWRMLRGSSVDGIAGIAPSRPLSPRIRLVRPLLPFHRPEIERYVRSLRPRVTPRRDETNESDTPLRNRVRRTLLPFLERRFGPGVRDSLARLAASARDDAEALEALAGALFRDAVRLVPRTGRPREARVHLPALEGAPDAVRSRACRKALAALGAPVSSLTRAHYDAMVRLLRGGRGGVDLPDGFRCEPGGRDAVFRRPPRVRHSR